jgi:hypothetical protein
MRLSAPRKITWFIAVFVGVLGILSHNDIATVSAISDFLLVSIGFVLLALATFLKGL